MREDGNTIVLEEAKSGQVDADDRWALWRRVRRTIRAIEERGDTRTVGVRLIANANALPPNPDSWRTLAVQSQSVDGLWFTPCKDERRKSASSARDLANEALHILASPDADDQSKPLDLQRARDVLSQFRFCDNHSAESVEETVKGQLAELSPELGLEVLVDALRGFLSRRAELPEPASRHFTSDEFLRSVEVLKRLAQIEPTTLRRWRSLQAAAVALDDLPLSGFSGLDYQDWKSLQPSCEQALSDDTQPAVALIGAGGLGKSVLLQRWMQEQHRSGHATLLLTSHDIADLEPDQLAEAVALGVFEARYRGSRFVLGIDAIENVGGELPQRAMLAALRKIASADVSVCVTSRLGEWRNVRGSDEKVPGWHEVELEEWSEELVGTLVHSSGRPSIGGDLVRLLRTPLFLDLFLRAFGQDADVPAGIQTRHGLIDAYWSRRILPRDDERSVERLSMLFTVASNEAQGRSRHRIEGPAAAQLTSEGLFVLNRGERSFRHTLLRDYAVGQWVRDCGPKDADIASRLEGIQSPFVQFGALRAVLEAESAEEPGRSRLISVLRRSVLFHAGTILGEFENLAGVSLDALVENVEESERASFLRCLLTSIKISSNHRWLDVIARLPDDGQWASRVNWIDGALIEQLAQTVDVCASVVAPHSARRIAELFRTWSFAPGLFAALSADEGFLLGQLVKLLVKIDPSSETASWMLRASTAAPRAGYWAVSELATLVRGLAKHGEAVDDALLAELYRRASGFFDDNGRLRHNKSVPSDPSIGYVRLQHALIGRGTEGLISIRPSVFVPIAVAILAGYEADEADERNSWRRDIQTRYTSMEDWCPALPEEVQILKNRAQNIVGESLHTQREVSGLIVDRPSSTYLQLCHDHDELLVHLSTLAARSLEGDGDLFDAYLWPSTVRGRSTMMRVCLLDMLTRSNACRRPAALDELLRDGRLYLVKCAQVYLQRGIRQRWARMSESDRLVIIANIKESGRSTSMGVSGPGPLLAAIPEEDRPQELSVFIELYRVSDLSLEIKEEAPISTHAVARSLASPTAYPPIHGLAPEYQGSWMWLSSQERINIQNSEEKDWRRVVDKIGLLLDGELPRPEALLERRQLVGLLSESCSTQLRLARESQNVPALDSEHVERLAQWAIGALQTLVTESAGQPAPEPDLRSGLWMAFVELADLALWLLGATSGRTLNAALFVAIDEEMRKPSADAARSLLGCVTGWFRGDGQGRRVLWSLLAERIRDGEALAVGLRFLSWFEVSEQRSLLELLLARNLQPRIENPREFVRQAGVYVGCSALMRNTETGKKLVSLKCMANG